MRASSFATFTFATTGVRSTTWIVSKHTPRACAWRMISVNNTYRHSFCPRVTMRALKALNVV